MFSATSSGINSAAPLYLWELTIQWSIATRAYDRIAEWARRQVEKDYSSRDANSRSPVAILADCSGLLNATAVTANILYAGKDAKKRDLQKSQRLAIAERRSSALRALLELEDMPTLRAMEVRNSFAHMDERIDRELCSNPSGKFVWVNLSSDGPPDAVVMRQLNPRTLVVSCLGDDLELRKCKEELNVVKARVDSAYSSIRKYEPLLNACTDVPSSR